MGQYLAADNAATLLAASVTNSRSVTSLILQDASKFPVVNHGGAGSDWSYVTLYDSANNIETVKLTRRDSGSNTLTIVRGTAAGISGVTDTNCLAWAATTTGVACRLVSQVVNDITAQAGTAAASASSAAASASSAAASASSAASAAASVSDAQTTANNAQTTANNAQTTANNAQTTANNAQTTANNLISGVVGFVKAKLGQAANTAYNFLFDASAADGAMKLVRENGQQVMTVDVNGKVSFPQGTSGGLLTMSTAQNTTSRTAIDFTGIPSWVKRITVMFNGVSTNGISNLLVRIGAGSIDSSGYSSAGLTQNSGGALAAVSDTSGFIAGYFQDSAKPVCGSLVLTRVSDNAWVGSLSAGLASYGMAGGGAKALSGTLDRIRITTVNGTDTFDAGAVNLIYEG